MLRRFRIVMSTRKIVIHGALLALVLCALEPLTLAYPQTTTQHGVAFSLELRKTSFTLHEPVCLRLTVHNTRAETVHFDLGPDRKGNFRLVITNPKGSLLFPHPLVPWGLARLGQVSLPPGGVFTQGVLVNEWYDFPIPGKYGVEVKIVDLSLSAGPGGDLSNRITLPSVTVHVRPRDEQSLIEACQLLSRGALHDPDFERRREDAVALSFLTDTVAVPYLADLANDRTYGEVAVLGLARIAQVEGVERVVSMFRKSDPTLEYSVRAALRNMSFAARTGDTK
jgi:hypothetical protein